MIAIKNALVATCLILTPFAYAAKQEKFGPEQGLIQEITRAKVTKLKIFDRDFHISRSLKVKIPGHSGTQVKDLKKGQTVLFYYLKKPTHYKIVSIELVTE